MPVSDQVLLVRCSHILCRALTIGIRVRVGLASAGWPEGSGMIGRAAPRTCTCIHNSMSPRMQAGRPAKRPATQTSKAAAAAPVGLTRTLAAMQQRRAADGGGEETSAAAGGAQGAGGLASSSKTKFFELLSAGWEGRNSKEAFLEELRLQVGLWYMGACAAWGPMRCQYRGLLATGGCGEWGLRGYGSRRAVGPSGL